MIYHIAYVNILLWWIINVCEFKQKKRAGSKARPCTRRRDGGCYSRTIGTSVLFSSIVLLKKNALLRVTTHMSTRHNMQNVATPHQIVVARPIARAATAMSIKPSVWLPDIFLCSFCIGNTSSIILAYFDIEVKQGLDFG